MEGVVGGAGHIVVVGLGGAECVFHVGVEGLGLLLCRWCRWCRWCRLLCDTASCRQRGAVADGMSGNMTVVA
jgi:hypothetical protein